MTQKKVNLVILNYNGRALLENFLPSILESAKASCHDCRVTVLDNCSQDDSAALVREHFREAELVLAKENLVLCSYNELAQKVDDDILILLNNDIRTEKDFVDPLIQPFLEHEDAFFVATHEDRAIPDRRWGIVSAEFSYPEYARAVQKQGYAFSAGIGAFDRKKFVELGGYDRMYLPGRYEDVDLCYRAWKRGWKGYYAPASKKFHVGGASFNEKYSSHQIQVMVFRNSVLFMLKNVTDVFWLLEFAFFTTLRLLTAPLFGKWFVVEGFTEALKRLPQALARRREASRGAGRTDREIFRIIRRDLCLFSRCS